MGYDFPLITPDYQWSSFDLANMIVLRYPNIGSMIKPCRLLGLHADDLANRK